MAKEPSLGNPKSIDLSLGSVVHSLRKTAGISQVDMGKVLDVHQSAVCRIEKGDQSLSPEQLFKLSKLFSVKVDSLLVGDIDYWRVAEKFEGQPPLPQRYRELAFSRVREVLPILDFMTQAKGASFAKKALTELGLQATYFGNPDQPIGLQCTLDLFRLLIKSKTLSQKNLNALIQYTRTEKVQGFLHHVYETQTLPFNLVQTWIMNAHHYESNFRYELEDLSRNSLVISIRPFPHMRDVQYKDAVLEDMLCRYKKGYFSSLPKYIGGKQLAVEEKECHFHGADKCVYTINAA